MTLDDHGWTQFLAAVRREIPSWEAFATEARVRASRSSSGSGEAVHGEDVAHACAHAHGMGQEDGFRAGVEAAAREVASWAADAAHFNGRERKALDFAAKQIRALSSAPSSPDSGASETP